MKTAKFLTLIILSILLIPINASGQKSSDDKSLYKMGVSQINITPEEPVMMSGYAARKTPSTGVHDSLYASALYFTGNNKQTLLITSDLIGFPSDMVDDIKKTINNRTGIPVENIFITAVHNHGGPSIRVYESTPNEATDRYISKLKENLLNLSVSAAVNPVPFKMGIGKGECFLNVNRRALLASGYIGLGRDQQKPCDHTLAVIRFEDLNNNLIALLINWPCHGTVTEDDNYRITGDWPGAAARYIKKEIGKNVVVAVTAGASADIDPLYGGRTNFNDVNTVGYNLARETVKVLSGISVKPVRDIQTANLSVKFPGKQRGADNKPPVSYDPAPEVELRLSGMKIGDLVLEGISGELMTEYGMQVKKSSPYKNTIIVTHCNGSSGYICTDQAYKEGGYEVMNTRMMPGMEKPLIAKFMDQIKSF
jgi:hypothetical protein